MPRIWATGIAVVATTLLIAPACAHNDESVVIQGVLLPPEVTDTGSCIFDPGSTTQLFSGNMDVAVAKSYQLVVKVENNIQARASGDKVRAESNSILLTGATVKLTRPTGETVDEFTNLASATIKPAQTISPTAGVMEVVAVSPKAAGILHDELKRRDSTTVVIANIKVFGRTLGGIDVESNEYPFPITVCRGCKIDFGCAPTGATTCNGPPPQERQAACKGTCFSGQDGIVPCQACTDPNEPACAKGKLEY